MMRAPITGLPTKFRALPTPMPLPEPIPPPEPPPKPLEDPPAVIPVIIDDILLVGKSGSATEAVDDLLVMRDVFLARFLA